jgi:hypothetical protein
LALSTLVARAVPLKYKTVPELKPVPFTVSDTAGPPAVVEDGERLVSVRPPVMVKGSAGGEVWPGEVTSTEACPGVAIKPAGTAAISCTALTKVVFNGLPFQVTTVLLVNPDPVAVRVKAGPPEGALSGEMLVRVSALEVTVKVNALDERVPLTAVIDMLAG